MPPAVMEKGSGSRVELLPWYLCQVPPQLLVLFPSSISSRSTLEGVLDGVTVLVGVPANGVGVLVRVKVGVGPQSCGIVPLKPVLYWSVIARTRCPSFITAFCGMKSHTFSSKVWLAVCHREVLKVLKSSFHWRVKLLPVP